MAIKLIVFTLWTEDVKAQKQDTGEQEVLAHVVVLKGQVSEQEERLLARFCILSCILLDTMVSWIGTFSIVIAKFLYCLFSNIKLLKDV